MVDDVLFVSPKSNNYFDGWKFGFMGLFYQTKLVLQLFQLQNTLQTSLKHQENKPINLIKKRSKPLK
jgi:hypothetical protein